MNTLYTVGSWVLLVFLTLFGITLIRGWYYRRINQVGPIPRIDNRKRISTGTPPRPETDEEYAARCPGEWQALLRHQEIWEEEVSGIRTVSRQLYAGLVVVATLITFMILGVARQEGVSEQDLRVAIGERVDPLKRSLMANASNIMELGSTVYALKDQVDKNNEAIRNLQRTGVVVQTDDNPQGRRIPIGDEPNALLGSLTNILQAQDRRMEGLIDTLLRDTDRRITSAIDPINRQIGALNAQITSKAKESSSGGTGGPQQHWVTNSYSALTRNHWPNRAKSVAVTIAVRYQHPLSERDALEGARQIAEEVHQRIGDKVYTTEASPENQAEFHRKARPVIHRWFQTASKMFRDNIVDTRASFSNETAIEKDPPKKPVAASK